MREGVVVSDKMDKTVVVVVERLVQHAQYKKYVQAARASTRRTTRQNRCGIGDRVRDRRDPSAQSRTSAGAVRSIVEKAS